MEALAQVDWALDDVAEAEHSEALLYNSWMVAGVAVGVAKGDLPADGRIRTYAHIGDMCSARQFAIAFRVQLLNRESLAGALDRTHQLWQKARMDGKERACGDQT